MHFTPRKVVSEVTLVLVMLLIPSLVFGLDDLPAAAAVIRQHAELHGQESNEEVKAAIKLLEESSDNPTANRLALDLTNDRLGEQEDAPNPVRFVGLKILCNRDQATTLDFLQAAKGQATDSDQQRMEDIIADVERKMFTNHAPTKTPAAAPPKVRTLVATLAEESIYLDQLESPRIDGAITDDTQRLQRRAEILLQLATRKVTGDYRIREKLELKPEWLESLAKIAWKGSREKPGGHYQGTHELRYIVSYAFAHASMHDWLLTKSLFERYGGRVGFGSLGLWLAPDGRNALIREAIEAGTFKIHDLQTEKAFWDAANKKNFADAYPTGDDLKRLLSYPPHLVLEASEK